MSSREIRVSSAKVLSDLLPKFDALKSQHGFKSDGDVIAFLLTSLEQPKSFGNVTFSDTKKPSGCDLTERQLVDFATKSLPMERLVHKGVLAESKRIHSESTNKNRVRGNRSESLSVIAQCVDTQIAINKQGDKSTQRFISGAWIQKQTDCNYPAIQEYLSIHQDVIDTHHKECEIDKDQNRIALREQKRDRKQAVTSNEDED